MHAAARFPVLAMVFLAMTGCAATGGDAPALSRSTPASPSSASATLKPTPTPTLGADKESYTPGTCLEIKATAREVTCDRPHNFEVTLSKRLDQRRKPSMRSVRRTCWSTLKTYLSSTDTAASRLEATQIGPGKGKDGTWRFTCMVVERGPKDEAVRRTGTLAGALEGGLDAFQLCLVGEPLDDPTKVVPCAQPHRSEAIPGVIPIKDFPPGRSGMLKAAMRAWPHCEKTGPAYLGGTRRGAETRVVTPLRQDWLDGEKDAICFVVSKTPVKGVMKSTGHP